MNAPRQVETVNAEGSFSSLSLVGLLHLYGTVFTAGWLQGPVALSAPMARTRVRPSGQACERGIGFARRHLKSPA
jgi:hypothetical protein